MTVRVAVDAMGRGCSPRSVKCSIADVAESDSDLEVLPVGDPATVSAELDSLARPTSNRVRSHLVHASRAVKMGESPVEALKKKEHSSRARMVLEAACQLVLKPLPSASRPGIAVTIPSFHWPFVLCEAGATLRPRRGTCSSTPLWRHCARSGFLGSTPVWALSPTRE